MGDGKVTQTSDHGAARRPPLHCFCIEEGSSAGPVRKPWGVGGQGGVLELGREGPEDEGGEGFLEEGVGRRKQDP